MSDINQARRAEMSVFFAGTDITSSLRKYLLSLTYTDNEEDETDDLQIKLHDRDNLWLESWLNTAIQSAAGSEVEEVEKQYKVTAQGGVAVHSSKEKKSKTLGTLAYGTVISVKSIDEGWANFKYSDKTGYVSESYLQPIYTGGGEKSAVSASSSASSSDWNIGDEVTVSGRPQYSSYGTGKPGANVTNYKGSITHLNLKSGVPYPICVGYLGWFAESQVSKAGGTVAESAPVQAEDEVGKGMKIQASITRLNWTGNGEEEKLECGQFELDSVTAQGPPATVTIKGTSLPYSSTIRQTKKSKSWENYTLKGIANEIAEKNGMTCMYLCSSDTTYARVEQYRISDIGFLQKLSQDAGFSLKITNNIIVIFDQAAYESKASVKTILRGKAGGYTKYKLSTGKNNLYTSCRVCYTDTSGNLITATAYVKDYDENKEDNQCLEIKQKVANTTEALALAKKMLRLHNKYEFTATFDFPGDPTLLAGLAVELKGWGAWDGKYIIKQAKHTISNSGYATQITLRRALNFDTAEGAATTTTKATKSVDELAREVIRGNWGNGEERKRRLTEAGYDYNAVQKRVNELLR